MTNEDGENLGYEDDSFDLYIRISRTIKSAIPIQQFREKIFHQFRIRKNQ